jgi:hypothetical protein
MRFRRVIIELFGAKADVAFLLAGRFTEPPRAIRINRLVHSCSSLTTHWDWLEGETYKGLTERLPGGRRFALPAA